MKVTALGVSVGKTVLKLEVPGFYIRTVNVNGVDHIAVGHPDAPAFLEKGLPELPRINRTIVIPDSPPVEISILKSEFLDFQLGPVVPSRGNLLRIQDIDLIPYEYDPFYRTDEWFPQHNVRLSKPFTLRDFRGVHVQFHPFQYNPATKTIRVATSLLVVVQSLEGATVNMRTRESLPPMDREFRDIYRQVFMNFSDLEKGFYRGIDEPGDLVIIAYDDFVDAVRPLAQWKIQKGLQTTVVPLGEIGASSAQIKQFLKSLYLGGDLTYVLLVGDADQIPILYGSTGAASDPAYVMLDGDDFYPDALISRISASTPSEVQAQVSKFLAYEKEPVSGNWYYYGIGVASNEGEDEAPDFLRDWERAEILREMLLGYTYQDVAQIYDPGASFAELVRRLNEGSSILNYLGHGTGRSWGTTGFDTLNALELVNGSMLPLIIDVSSKNGQWSLGTCLAEAFLRNPAGGAVGMFSASVSPAWVPPTVMQKHIVELLVNEAEHTMGGLTARGAIHALQAYNGGAEGIAIVEEYNLFGDCSLPIRTVTPGSLRVSHNATILLGSETFAISTDVSGAMVGLSMTGTLYGSGVTDELGVANLEFVQEVDTPGQMILTVTHPATIPYITTIDVLQSTTPFIAFQSYSVNDTLGNSDGTVDFGETVGIRLTVANHGLKDAVEVTAIVSTSDPFATLSQDRLDFGRVNHNEVVESVDEIIVDVSEQSPDGHAVLFDVEFSCSTEEDSTFVFEDRFTVSVEAPVLRFVGYSVENAGTNGIVDAGESVELVITLINEGGESGEDVVMRMREVSEYMRVDNGTATISSIPGEGGVASNAADPFLITASGNTPLGSEVLFDLQMQAQHGYRAVADFVLTIGENEFYSQDTPKDFGPVNITSTLNVSTLQVVDDLDVTVDITHSWIEDVQLSLESPAGTVVTLVSGAGGQGDNFEQTVFDDDASIPISQGRPPFSGSFLPEQPLSLFTGEESSGEWTLTVVDNNPPLNHGTLNSWSIKVKGEGATASCTKGDVNRDGTFNILDIVATANIVLSRERNPTAFEVCAADFDGDGEILVFDLIRMINILFDFSVPPDMGPIFAKLTKQPRVLKVDAGNQLGGLFLVLQVEGDFTLHSVPGVDTYVAESERQVSLLAFSSKGLAIDGQTLFSVDGEYRVEKLEISDLRGNRVQADIVSIPQRYALHQNYPNPFNSVTRIPFDLREGGRVSLAIYNLLGQKIRTLTVGEIPAGFHEASWDGTDDRGDAAGAGVYLCRISVNGYVQTRKMLFLK